jgi:hypothetical protein
MGVMTNAPGIALLEHAALRVAIGEQPSEDLPGVATEALLSGVDSVSLRLLAGTSSRDVRGASDLFDAALDQLGIAYPSEQEAHWRLVRAEAELIVAGEVGPCRRRSVDLAKRRISALRLRETSECSCRSHRSRR